jgi:hypothetical protein
MNTEIKFQPQMDTDEHRFQGEMTATKTNTDKRLKDYRKHPEIKFKPQMDTDEKINHR